MVESVHDRQRNVGVTAAIATDGAPAWGVALGHADLEHEVPATPATLFAAASVTKLVTAVAVLRLRAEGRLDLDVPVQRYVPGFPEHPEGTITARLLATHRSGLPHPSNRTPALFAAHYATATDALEVFRDVALVSRPGERRVYSSSNYTLLAAVVEAVTGAPFQERVHETILEPVGMRDTRFDDVLAVVPRRAERYSFYHPWTREPATDLYRVPDRDYSFNLGGGGLLSTAVDLARLGDHLTRPGILDPEGLALLFSDDWFGRVDPAGERWALVTGANPGTQAGLGIFPARDVAAAVLSNTWGVGSQSNEMVILAAELAKRCRPEAKR